MYGYNRDGPYDGGEHQEGAHLPTKSIVEELLTKWLVDNEARFKATEATMKNMEAQLQQMNKTLSEEALLDNIEYTSVDQVQVSLVGSNPNEFSNEEVQTQGGKDHEEEYALELKNVEE